MVNPAMHSSAPFVPEVFARHAAALRALARALVREPADAEDVVQETWVAYLQSPPSKLESLGGWLSTVLRRRASNRRRESARREQHEQGARRPESFDPRPVQQQEQTLHAVVAAVSALEEPLKQVVMLRYFEGLAPGQVAERLGVAPSVVYDRLHRAHAKLRARLEGEFGSAHALILALSTFSGDEVSVAPPGAPTAGTATPSPWFLSPVALGAAAALSLVVIAVVLREEAPLDERLGREGVAAGSSTALGERAAIGASEVDGVSSTRAVVGVHGSGERAGPSADARALPEPPHEFELELTLLDHLDRSQARTEVFAGPAGGSLNLIGSIDVNGRFTLRTRAWSALAELDLALGADGVVRRIALTGGRQSLTLRTPPTPSVTLNGFPLIAAVDAQQNAHDLGVLAARLQRAPHASSDLAGRMTFMEPLLAFGAHERRVDPDGPPLDMNDVTEENFVATGEPVITTVDRAAPMKGRVAGVVLDSEGAARADIVVSLRRADAGGWSTKTSDERGFFEFGELDAGDYVVQASGNELGVAHQRMSLAAGQRTNWDARLELGEVFEGTFVDHAGRPLRGWSIEVEGESGADLAITDSNGRVRIANAPRGALRVLARPITLPAVPPLLLASGVHAADGARQFALEFEGDKPLGELRLFLPELSAPNDGSPASSDPSQQPRERRRESEVRFWRVDSQRGTSPLWSDATVEPRSLRAMLLPGAYRVEVLVAGREPHVLGPLFLAADEVRELSLALSPGAQVEFVSPASNEEMFAVLLRRGSSFDALTYLPGVNSSVEELRPGAYSLLDAMSGRWLADFEAQAGATLKVQLAPATR